MASRRHKVHANQIYFWRTSRVLSRPKRWAEAMPRCARPNCSRGADDGARFFITRAIRPGGSWSNPTPRCRCAQAVRAAWRESVEPVLLEPLEPDGEQLALMRRMDELHLKHPFDDADTQSGGVGRQPQACAASHAVDGAREHCAQAEHKQASAGTHGIPLSTESDGFSSIRCGPPTSHTSRWREASYTWWRSSIGILGGCSPGACPTRWRRPSAWRP